MLAERLEPVELASIYEECGAAAVSILTDEKFFKGSLDDLTVVRKSIKLPCLRKEFMLDEYQIYQARAAQADAILLIVRILPDSQLREFRELATSLGMAALVECHDAEEVRRAIESDAQIIGINNRDLQTFDVDLNTTLELRKHVPGGKVLVSESGIFTREHVRTLEGGGVDAILVGEALVTSGDVRAKIRELLGRDDG
jgi:indole-3-glycerol phosphate synthase